MSFRSLLSAVLSCAVISWPASSHAEEAAVTDVELMTALHVIAQQNKIWTADDWREFGIKTAKVALVATAAVGAGTAIYYFRNPRGWSWKSLMISKEALVGAREFVLTHGGKVVLGVAGPIVITNLVNRLTAMNNMSDAERLRTASTPDARIYRSHLRQFFKLTISEQFLIARQDEVLMRDLVRLAKLIEEKHVLRQRLN